MTGQDSAAAAVEWSGVALALRGAGHDRMQSRLATHLHPLAGRALAWHVLRALAVIEPAPRRLGLLGAGQIDPGIRGALPVDTGAAPTAAACWAMLGERAAGETSAVMVVDATAAGLSRSLVRLACGATGRALADTGGAVLAVLLDAADLAERAERLGRGWSDVTRESAAAPTDLAALADGLEVVEADAADGFLVNDRATLARANGLIRDRIVGLHMEAGVTFLLPETVLVDVDVAIERDTVIYPGVALEGSTSIGAETVVGPGCRIIDSSIGRGVELKGWNYLSRTSIRNRFVLEPYVRRGFD